MRLISIDIKNFRVIKDAHIEFPDAVIGIIGRNGAGKSSIIEAISWALYGNQAARSGKNEIKSIFASNNDECRIELSFFVNDEKYRVVRRLIGKTNRAEVELYRGNASESVGVNETKSYVGQLLGLDWKSFLSSFLARQAELNALSDLQPSRRRDHIAGMLGIEKLDKAISKIKDDSKLNKEKSTFLQNQLSQKEVVEKQITEMEKSIKDMDEPILNIQKQVNRQKEIYNQAKSDLDLINKKRIDFIKLEGRLKSEKETNELLKQQLDSNESEMKELKLSEDEYKILLPKQDEYKLIIKKYNDLLLIKSQFELFEQLNKRLSELETEKKKVYEELIKTENLRDKNIKQMEKIPLNIIQELQKIRDELQKSRENYVRMDSEIKQLQAERNRLSEQLANIKKLKADSVCDHCLRPFGDNYEKIKEHFKEDLEKLDESYTEKVNNLSDLKAEGFLLKKKENESSILAEKHTALKNEQKLFVGKVNQLNDRLKELSTGIEKTKKEIAKIGIDSFDSSKFSKLEHEKSLLEEDISKINLLKGRLEQIPKLEKSIETTRMKLKVVDKNLNSIEKEIVQLDYDDSGYESAVAIHEKEQAILENIKTELSELRKEKDVSLTSLNGKKDLILQFERSEKELDETISKLYYSEKLNQLLIQYRKDLIASIRPSLATISTGLFKEMTDNRYSLVELDEQYNLRVMDGGEFYDIDRFSGGEKDLANLCLRLAISLALTESAGLEHSFVILDEVFGSQDNERKELILRSLAKLKSHFPQILLITHIDDIKNGVEKIIEVLPTGNGFSEINIV